MLIIPAIDLKGGKCVRLLRGEMSAETVYGDDPVAIGKRWVEQGAQYLHVVDLDGAVGGPPEHARRRRSLDGGVPVHADLGGAGGGVGRPADGPALGAERVLIGPAALAEPEVVGEACGRFAGRVAVGIDARDGKV